MVRRCPKNCWMVGTASPVMHKYIKHPLRWALKNKLRSMRGLKPCLDKTWYDVGQDPVRAIYAINSDSDMKIVVTGTRGIPAYSAVWRPTARSYSRVLLRWGTTSQ